MAVSTCYSNISNREYFSVNIFCFASILAGLFLCDVDEQQAAPINDLHLVCLGQPVVVVKPADVWLGGSPGLAQQGQGCLIFLQSYAQRCPYECGSD